MVDANGDVFAKFEGVVGADERRSAIEDALAQTGLTAAQDRDRCPLVE